MLQFDDIRTRRTQSSFGITVQWHGPWYLQGTKHTLFEPIPASEIIACPIKMLGLGTGTVTARQPAPWVFHSHTNSAQFCHHNLILLQRNDPMASFPRLTLSLIWHSESKRWSLFITPAHRPCGFLHITCCDFPQKFIVKLLQICVSFSKSITLRLLHMHGIYLQRDFSR